MVRYLGWYYTWVVLYPGCYYTPSGPIPRVVLYLELYHNPIVPTGPNTPTLWWPMPCNPFNSSFRSHLNFGQLYYHQFGELQYWFCQDQVPCRNTSTLRALCSVILLSQAFSFTSQSYVSIWTIYFTSKFYFFNFASKSHGAKQFRSHDFIRAQPKYHIKLILPPIEKSAETIFDKFSNPIHSPPIVWPRGWIHGTSENSWRRLKSNFQQFLKPQFWWGCWL